MTAALLRQLLRVTVFSTAVFALAAPRSATQCLVPDGLDVGNCCQLANLTLPPFPAAATGGLGICWNACSVAGTQNLQVSWTPPSSVACGEFITQLTVSDTSGAPLMSGTLVLDYTRSWDEIDTTGLATQVWRFAAKADLSTVTGGGTSLCVQPNCIAPAGPYGTSFYYGYVDYAGCSTSGPFENTLVLFHNCDRFIHRPGLSDKPGAFHPAGSFAIVAPHVPAQPFVPANTLAAGGLLFGEATRNVSSIPGTNICTVEDPIVSGSMTPLAAGCICTLSNNPKQQTLRQFRGTTACVNAAGLQGSFTSVKANFPTFPWFHMVSTSIGAWTSPLVYPGKEECWVDEGIFLVQDSCTGDFAEFKYGGSTRNGWTPLLPIPIAVNNFTDLADNYTAPANGPYPFPFLGSVQPTDHLVYANEP